MASYLTCKLSAEQLKRIADDASILIVTAADVEAEAVRNRLSPLPNITAANGKVCVGTHHDSFDYDIGLFGGYLVVHANLLAQGDEIVASTLSEARRTWPNIKLVAMPGMAFGLHSITHDRCSRRRGGQLMGDILVATGILNANLENPELKKMNDVLIHTLSHRKERFVEKFKIPVHFGIMLSVSEVVRNTKTRSDLKVKFGLYPSGSVYAIGGEMESLALLNTERFFTQIPNHQQLYVILAKAISDWGFNKPSHTQEGRDQHNKDRQRASQNSVKYLLSMFEDEDVPNELCKIAIFDVSLNAKSSRSTFDDEGHDAAVSVLRASSEAAKAASEAEVHTQKLVLIDKQFLEYDKIKNTDDDIEIGLAEKTPEHEDALRSLRNRRGSSVSISFHNVAAIATIQNVQWVSDVIGNRWEILLKRQAKVGKGSDVDYDEYTVEHIAQMRARLILLNELPTLQGGINETLRQLKRSLLENFLRNKGLHGHRVSTSDSLPQLRRRCDRDSKTFIPRARLWAIRHLLLSETVDKIVDLELGPVSNGKLPVSFKGVRENTTFKGDATEIRVEGECSLESENPKSAVQ